jgi:hypothetical protein
MSTIAIYQQECPNCGRFGVMNTTYDPLAVSGSGEKSELFSLTRMIYAVSGGILPYLLLEYSGWFFFQRKQVSFFDCRIRIFRLRCL